MANISIVNNYMHLQNLPDAMINAIQNSVPDALIPDASPNTAFLPWNYENAAWATHVKLPALSPFLRDYDFPRPPTWDVMEHQMRIGEFMTRTTKAFVLAGMGSGKTASALWATDYLLKIGQIKKVLIICPVAVAYDAWLPSVTMLFLQNRRVVNLHKTPNLCTSDAEYHVINYDKLEGHIDKLMKAGYDCIILDESTKIKTATTKRHKCAKRLVKAAKFSWQLTGKPTPQGPMDAHGQVALFGLYTFSKSWWEASTMHDYGNYRKVPRQDWQDTVKQYMMPAIRVDTRDCVDLPPVIYSYSHIPLTKFQTAAIQALRADNIVSLAGVEITSAHAAAALQKIVQIASGAVYDGTGQVIEVRATDRLNATLEIVEQADNKSLVFVPFKHIADLVAEYLTKAGFHVGVITSDTKHRQAIFDNFQNKTDTKDPIEIIVAIPDAMAHGVTLTEADTIVWYGPPRSNEIYQQANARADRKGQTRKVKVVNLWGHKREHDMYEMSRLREQDQEAFMALYTRVRSDIEREFF